MSGLFGFAAGLTLLLPVFGQGDAERPSPVPFAAPLSSPQSASRCTAQAPAILDHETRQNHSEPPAPKVEAQVSAANPLEAFYRLRTANQHRIERRLTIRITPLRQSNRNNLLAQLPRRGVAQAFEEREMEGCVPVSGIAGVQTSTGNRLLLFLRDQRIVSLNLERGCEARDFYSGFYVERSEDGRLCVKRDQLQSRSGAKCEVERMRRLVRTGE